MNKQFVTLSSLFSGVILSQSFLYLTIYLAPQTNVEISFVDNYIRFFLLFFIGAYAGAAIPWLYIKNERAYQPLFVALSLAMGLLVGSIAAKYTDPYIPGSRERELTLKCFMIIGALIGARLACNLSIQKPRSRIGIGISLFTGLALSILPLFFTSHISLQLEKNGIVYRGREQNETIQSKQDKIFRYLRDERQIKEIIGMLEGVEFLTDWRTAKENGIIISETDYRAVGNLGELEGRIFFTEVNQNQWEIEATFFNEDVEAKLPKAHYRMRQI